MSRGSPEASAGEAVVRRRSPPHWPELVLVAAATLAGALLRVAVARHSQVWLDEANGVLLASAGLGRMAELLRLDSSPPLYYVLLRGWIAVSALEPLALRVPSLVAGVAALPLAWWIGRRLDRPATGAIAACLLAVHPLHVHYSEEIRMYALVVLLALALCGSALGRNPRGPSPWIAAPLGAALAWTHYYGLVFAGVVLGWRALADRGGRRRALWSGVGVALLFAPCLSIFLAQLGSPHHVEWIRPFWDRYPAGAGLLRSLQAFLPGGMKYEFLPLAGLPWQGLVVLAAAWPVVAWAWRARGGAGCPRLALDGAVVVVATLAILVAYSYATWPIYLAGRSDVVVLPAFLLAYAALIARSGRRTRVLALALLGALSLAELWRSAPALRKPGNREIAAAIDARDCRTVLTTGLAYATVRYHEQLDPPPARVLAFPSDIARHAGNFDLAAYDAAALEADAEALAAAQDPAGRLCLLAATAPYARPLVRRLTAERRILETVSGLYTSLLREPYALHVLSPADAGRPRPDPGSGPPR